MTVSLHEVARPVKGFHDVHASSGVERPPPEFPRTGSAVRHQMLHLLYAGFEPRVGDVQRDGDGAGRVRGVEAVPRS